MSFRTLWRVLLPLLGVWLLSASAANAMFLSTDPIGTRDDPNLYMYVGLDPVNMVDPTGLDGYAYVYTGNRVELKADVYFHGAGATPANIAAAVSNMQSAWTGQFGKYDTTMTINVLSSAPTDQSDSMRMAMSVEITAGPTSQNSGHSYMNMGSGRDTGQLAEADIFGRPLGSAGNQTASDKGADTPAHEIGHGFNIIGHDPIGSGTLMDGGAGRAVTEGHIDTILADTNNNTVYDCQSANQCTMR